MIRFGTFGALDLRADGGAEIRSVLAQPKRTALLAYLAVATPRGFHRRDTLLGLLWPDLDATHARGALSKAIHYLRRALGDDVIESRGDEELCVRRERLWCDAAAFGAAVEAGSSAEALALYRGDFLAGFFIEGAPDFERWVDDERRTLRRAAADAAWRLAEAAEAAGEGERAGAWARRAAKLADDEEGVVRRVVALLDRVGERAVALRLYQGFAQRLREECDAEPSAETRALVEKLRRRHAAPPQASEAGAAAGPGKPAEAVSAV